MEKQERQEMILNILFGVGILTTAIVAPNAIQLFKYFLPRSSKEEWNIRQSFSRLEKKGYLEKRTTNGENYYTLTLIGSERAKKYKLHAMKISPQKKWDGQWRLVMFDVPEDKKMARRGINLVLKKLGCVQYQKSVFITPFPCKKEIDFVGDCFNARKYLRIITAREVEGTEPLKKVFKLR